jgi:glycosyltransferase involved in cell wall biosynthesis
LVLAATPDLLDFLPQGAHYLPNPIDTDLFDASFDFAEPETVLIFSSLIDIKGAPIILDAVEQIRKMRPDVVIRGFAGGKYEARARALGIDLLPFLNRREVAEQLQWASVVIGQQHLGILSQAELEAMASRRPVVVYVDDRYYETPVPIESAHGSDEVTQCVLDLLDDKSEARQLGEAARRYVEEYHSFSNVGKTLAEMYRDLLQG